MSGMFQIFLADWKTGIEFAVSISIGVQQASRVTLKTCGGIRIFCKGWCVAELTENLGGVPAT